MILRFVGQGILWMHVGSNCCLRSSSYRSSYVDLCRLIGKVAIFQSPFISVRIILVNHPSANFQQAFFTLMFIPRAQYASPSSMKTLYGLLTFLCSLFFKSFCVIWRFTILPWVTYSYVLLWKGPTPLLKHWFQSTSSCLMYYLTWTASQ